MTNRVVREIDGADFVLWSHVQDMRRTERERALADIERLRHDFGQTPDGRMALDVARDVVAQLSAPWSLPNPDVTRALVKNDPIWKRIWTLLTVRSRARKQLRAYDARNAVPAEDPAS